MVNVKVTRNPTVKVNTGTSKAGIVSKGTIIDRVEKGTTFYPNVTNEGIISWTNDGGMENPAEVDLVAPVKEYGDKTYVPIERCLSNSEIEQLLK